MKELWIHAGMPKNGSSAIQVFLAKNIDKLKKEGLDYIELSSVEDAKKGLISSGNGALLARSMLEKEHEAFHKDDVNLYGQLLEDISNSTSKKILLSSEFFAVVPLKRIKQLKEDLFKINVILKFIYYVRRQDQFLMSSYMQRVKRHGYTGYPDDYTLDSYKNIHFLNYYGYANLYADILGKENLYPFIYENTKEHDKGLIGHFMKVVLGVVPHWIEMAQSVNTSPSAKELKFILVSNQYSPRMNFSDFIIEDSISRGRSEEYKKHSIVSPEITNTVLNYFKEQNEKFCKEYTSGESFPSFIKVDYIDLKNVTFSTEELMEIVAGLLVRYDRRLSKLEIL
jgi:hypothetical protein